MQGSQMAVHVVHSASAQRQLSTLVFCLGPSPSLWLYKPNRKAMVAFELFWRLVLAMTQSLRGTCGYLMAVGGATRLPPPRSDDSAAAGPPLLIRQTLSVCLVCS